MAVFPFPALTVHDPPAFGWPSGPGLRRKGHGYEESRVGPRIECPDTMEVSVYSLILREHGLPPATGPTTNPGNHDLRQSL